MAMQKRYLLVVATVAAGALFSAQQGPACPYAHAHRAVGKRPHVASMSSGGLAAGSVFYLVRSEAFAP
jgi:hypothetical protein